MILFSLPRRVHCRFVFFFIVFFSSALSVLFFTWFLQKFYFLCWQMFVLCISIRYRCSDAYTIFRCFSVFLRLHFLCAKIICPNYCASWYWWTWLIAFKRLWSKEAFLFSLKSIFFFVFKFRNQSIGILYILICLYQL